MSMNTRPLSILHVLAPTDVGGLETVVINLSAEQRRRGHAVAIATVVPPGRPDHPLFARVARTGIAVHTVALGARAYLRERRMIGRLCQRIRPDVVHTHGFRPDILDAPAARKNGAASVTTVHGFLAGTWRGRVYEWLQERSYRRFDAVVAVSRAIR